MRPRVYQRLYIKWVYLKKHMWKQNGSLTANMTNLFAAIRAGLIPCQSRYCPRNNNIYNNCADDNNECCRSNWSSMTLAHKLHRWNRASVFVSNIAEDRWEFIFPQLLWLGMHNPCKVKEKQLSLRTRGPAFRFSKHDTVGSYRWPNSVLWGEDKLAWDFQTRLAFSTVTQLLGKAFLML